MIQDAKTLVFIERTKKVHGNTYDYSKVIYKNIHTDIEIICKNHFSFKQSPNNHLKGKGCKKCGRENSIFKRRRSNDEFIQQAKEKHGDKYDYSETNYINKLTPVKIKCKEHGTFLQIPDVHLKPCGCPKCSQENSGNKQKLTFEQFLEKSKNIHGNK